MQSDPKKSRRILYCEKCKVVFIFLKELTALRAWRPAVFTAGLTPLTRQGFKKNTRKKQNQVVF